MNLALSGWRLLSPLPLGRRVFSLAMCLRVPYFATVRPELTELRPGRCAVRARNRRRVRNHIGTFHAIAMCNMAEIAAGLLTEVSIPPTHRWIPSGMTVEYRAKAHTDLTAVAALAPFPASTESMDVTVPVDVLDADGQVVLAAHITMRVSPRLSQIAQ